MKTTVVWIRLVLSHDETVDPFQAVDNVLESGDMQNAINESPGNEIALRTFQVEDSLCGPDPVVLEEASRS